MAFVDAVGSKQGSEEAKESKEREYCALIVGRVCGCFFVQTKMVGLPKGEGVVYVVHNMTQPTIPRNFWERRTAC